jgi:hypothetical protein
MWKLHFLSQTDPFLQLVEESRLFALDAPVDIPARVYGLSEDNSDALERLSEIKSKEDEQSRSTMVSTIINSLGELPEVSCICFIFLFLAKNDSRGLCLFILLLLSLDRSINQ